MSVNTVSHSPLSPPRTVPSQTPVAHMASARDLQVTDRIARIPDMLRMRLVLILVLTVATTLCGLMAYRAYEGVVRTIGLDTVPSIVAAEKIRSTLAAAHTQAVNVFLATRAADRTQAAADFRKSTGQANQSLVDASQNITYGDEERQPILKAMNGLADYLQTLGAAFALAPAQPGGALPEAAGTALAHADELMRDTILPATRALDDANFTHMDAAFHGGRQHATLWLCGLIAMTVALGVALLHTQVLMTTVFRRRINIPMATGTGVLIVCTLLFAGKALNTAADIRTAKLDAFDSVHALTQAQAVAYIANAAESVYLIDQGRTEAQAGQTAIFRQASDQLLDPSLLGTDMDRLVLDAGTTQGLKGKGLLADELANITFPGEESAARATAAAWNAYVSIDARIRALEGASRHADAVTLCNGTQPGQSDWAFEQFDRALERTLKINQDQFDAAISRGLAHAAWLWILLIPLFLGPALGAVVGIRQRLAEFGD